MAIHKGSRVCKLFPVRVHPVPRWHLLLVRREYNGLLPPVSSQFGLHQPMISLCILTQESTHLLFPLHDMHAVILALSCVYREIVAVKGLTLTLDSCKELLRNRAERTNASVSTSDCERVFKGP